jgi:polyphosphate kinase
MDNVKARVLEPDGTYHRVSPPGPGEPVVRSQVEFQNMARELSSTAPMRPSSAFVAPVPVFRSLSP